MKEGLEEAIKIIDKELQYARTIDISMSLGMAQVKALIIKKLEELPSTD